MDTWIEKLRQHRDLPDEVLVRLIEDPEGEPLLFQQADAVRRQYYGTDVYIRGLIEVSNYCRNDCKYCGIRAGNRNAHRYRLDRDTVLDCCRQGYALGFRTFVLQGGEDPYFTDEVVGGIVSAIKTQHPDCAVTLSLGEQPYQSYQKWFDAGADRYLLRHETANAAHYGKLHPPGMNLEHRKSCLWELKRIGYQVGAGFMVGSPYQTTGHILEDLRFLQQLQPDMIGFGPFIAQADTEFAGYPSGDLRMCLRLIAILRLMFPYALIPATTALSTLHPQGREMGLKAGANVVMPNLSPMETRAWYALYDHKIHTGEEAAEYCALLRERIKTAGYEMVTHIGHVCRRQKITFSPSM